MKYQCSDYNAIFDALAYYGFFEKADAHCYRVEATIESGAYVLGAACLLLIVLNSFVTKATYHYFWDKESAHKMSTLQKQADPEESPHMPDDPDTMSKIRPPPILFTDAYRWLMRREHLGDRPMSALMMAPSHTPSSHEHLSNASLEESIEEVVEESNSDAVLQCLIPASSYNKDDVGLGRSGADIAEPAAQKQIGDLVLVDTYPESDIEA